MYIYEVMVYVDYDFYNYYYYKNKKQYSDTDFYKIIGKIIKKHKNSKLYLDGLCHAYESIQDELEDILELDKRIKNV